MLMEKRARRSIINVVQNNDNNCFLLKTKVKKLINETLFIKCLNSFSKNIMSKLYKNGRKTKNNQVFLNVLISFFF